MAKYNYTDLAISEDGDILLSAPRLDNSYNVMLNEDGREVRDILFVSKDSAIKQAIDFRLKTELGDMYIQPGVGIDIDKIIGKRNTKETATEGEQAIRRALTYGGLIDSSDITIVPIPLDNMTIIYHVEVHIDGYTTYKLDLSLDLENGMRRI